MELDEAFAALLDRLRAWRAPVLQSLLPGLPPHEIETRLAADGLPAPAELVVWWGAHDGAGGPAVGEGGAVDQRPENALLDPYHLLSLADALRLRRFLREEYEAAGAPEIFPEPWLPVLSFTGMPLFCADTAAADAAGRVPIQIADEAMGGGPFAQPPRFPSLGALVAALVDRVDAGGVEPSRAYPGLPSLAWDADDPAARRLLVW